MRLAVAVAMAAVTASAPAESASRLRGWLSTAERSQEIELAHSGPYDRFGRTFRDIDITSLSVVRGFRGPKHVEVRAAGSLLVATGTRWEPFSATAPQGSDAAGLSGMLQFRYYVPVSTTIEPFIEVGAGVLLMNHAFPAGGSAVNLTRRWGGGLRWNLNARHSLSAGFTRSHISNGGGITSGNPSWDGQGWALAWTHHVP